MQKLELESWEFLKFVLVSLLKTKLNDFEKQQIRQVAKKNFIKLGKVRKLVSS